MHCMTGLCFSEFQTSDLWVLRGPSLLGAVPFGHLANSVWLQSTVPIPLVALAARCKLVSVVGACVADCMWVVDPCVADACAPMRAGGIVYGWHVPSLTAAVLCSTVSIWVTLWCGTGP